jgi:DNA replication protein DnaC
VELEQEIWWFWYDLTRSLPANIVRGRLLVLYGENGTGKTHCAKAVYSWARTCRLQYVETPGQVDLLSAHSEFWAWPELLDAFKNGNWDIVRELNECALLILDELGGGHDPSGVGTDKLCQVLSRRENKWTIVTTNSIPESWEEKFDRRVASRFFRNSIIVDLTGVPDFSLRP